MYLVDSISFCLDDSHGKRRDPIAGIAIHRFGVDGCHDASGVARFCRNEGTTGHKMAYGYVVGFDGTPEQALPDNRWGWSSLSSSRELIAVAVLGDFRWFPPTPTQWSGVVRLCEELMTRWWLPVWSIVGHDEIVGGSKHPNKICPGNAFRMDILRDQLNQDRK
jgi:hypothetical protein